MSKNRIGALKTFSNILWYRFLAERPANKNKRKILMKPNSMARQDKTKKNYIKQIMAKLSIQTAINKIIMVSLSKKTNVN